MQADEPVGFRRNLNFAVLLAVLLTDECGQVSLVIFRYLGWYKCARSAQAYPVCILARF